jgi:glycine/D-amino acid oxidase-like deaminating enzyme
MRAHQELAASVPGCDWYHQTGNVQWAGDDNGRKALHDKVADLLTRGYEARWLTRQELLRLEPDLDPDRLPADGIAYFPGEGWIEPVRLVAHLLSAAGYAGAELIRDDAVTGLDLPGGKVQAVLLASGRRLRADAVVNCAGPRAATIAEFAGLTLPMRNSRAVLFYTSPVAISVARVIHSPRVYLRPDGGERLLLHCEEIDSSLSASGDVPPGVADEALEAGCEIYPGMRPATVESVRVGERPFPGDGMPVLGRVTELPGFYFAVSHSGATLCLHAGDLVAAEVLGEDVNDALTPYRFERFPLVG